jgi:hypothetical protein
MVTPGCAVTLAVFPAWTVTAVSCRVVSTSNVLAGSPEDATSGDQLKPPPSGRIRQPFAYAQLASVTTAVGVAGAHIHARSTATVADQFVNVRRYTGMPLGKSGGLAGRRAMRAATIRSSGLFHHAERAVAADSGGDRREKNGARRLGSVIDGADSLRSHFATRWITDARRSKIRSGATIHSGQRTSTVVQLV